LPRCGFFAAEIGFNAPSFTPREAGGFTLIGRSPPFFVVTKAFFETPGYSSTETPQRMSGFSQKMWGSFYDKQRCLKHEQNLIKLQREGQMKKNEQRSDSKMATEIKNAIQCITTIPVESLSVTVNEDWVCLQGTLKDRHQKEVATKVVQQLSGVRGVTNLIKIDPQELSQN
jgi:osmotically-inducible protein OsmY